MIKVGDRVKVIHIRQFKKELIEDINKFPIHVFEISKTYWCDRLYRINIGCDPESVVNYRWVNESDITLDIEYYRNIKLENILK